MRDWESAGELEMAGYVSLFSFTRTLWIWRNLSPWLASHFRSIIFSLFSLSSASPSPSSLSSFYFAHPPSSSLSLPRLFFLLLFFIYCLLFVIFSVSLSSLSLGLSRVPLPVLASSCLRGGAGGGGGGGGRRPGCLVSHFRCIRPPCVLKFFF